MSDALTALGGAPQAPAAAGGDAGGRHAELVRLAQQFEGMLLTQMLRDMRKASSWSDEEEQGSGFGGFDALSDTLDSELGLQLARTKSIGIADDLVRAFEKFGASTTMPLQVPATGHAPEEPGSAERPVTADEPVTTALRVTSPFGWRRDPFTGDTTFHRGIDVRAAYGDDVRAAAAGTVVASGTQGGYGTTVVVEHSDGTRTRYAHLSARTVEVGAEVGAGQVLGRAGQSGRATGPHLHFEVTTASGQAISPSEWLQNRVVPPEV